MAEKITDATTRMGRIHEDNGRQRTSDEVVREILGDRATGFDAHQVVYPQESIWVLDMRLASNDETVNAIIREDFRTLCRAYFKYGRRGRFLRTFSWEGVRRLI